ncbi:MAG TPA: hypothetical protein VGM32_09735 [Rhodopila sp.]
MSDAKGSQTLSAQQRAKLAGILSRLSSPFEGERAAAGLLATAFVTRHNLAWSDLTDMVRPGPQLPATPVDPQPEGDRRLGGKPPWRGYCRRRRRSDRGAAFDLST